MRGSLFGLKYETEPTRLSGTETGEMMEVDYSTVRLEETITRKIETRQASFSGYQKN